MVVLLFNCLPVRYYYVYGDTESGWSAEASFVSAPLPSPSETVRLIAYGDLGKGLQDNSIQMFPEQASLNTTAAVAAQVDSTDLILHIGDIAYAEGYAPEWDEFFSQIEPIASRVPYMTCIGNHERDFPDSGSNYKGRDSGGECGVAYEMRFPMPRVAYDQPWYNFDFGPVHVLVMSTEQEFLNGSIQYDYIEHDLLTVDRNVTPWVIVAGHRPMYIDSNDWSLEGGDQVVAKSLRETYGTLFIQSGVDLCIWGHHHAYQRTCPVHNEVCVEPNADGSNAAPVHCVIGMAGAALASNRLAPQPRWLQYVDDWEFGYTRLQINATQLTIELVANVDGGVRDSYTMTKPALPYPE
eukprot:TRINITY_DN1225_c0_g2_i3.p1 TRINITY_DN1225_c0_g2~~TRINITY_DN1225_c0_g2_i3.p1  ORF type:complete len:353 (-),score=59.68 TRINITY_DN1225_c0_g2_i3:924-1982(-)